MRIATTLFGLAALTLAMGCGDGKPGGPGANKADGTPAKRGDPETFTLDVQNTAVNLTQGEAKATTISIKRGKNIDEDVKIVFADVPKGVTFDPAAPMIKHGDKEVTVSVTAAADAALGDHIVRVTGKPTRGGLDAETTIKISVSKK